VFHLLTSSDLFLPPALWTPVDTNAFDENGEFRLTNTFNLGESNRFYLLRLP
jgi:hypothetical protein